MASGRPIKNTTGIVSEGNPKGAGRPFGSGRRGNKRWQPMVWKPLYDQIIALRLANYEVKKIAEVLDISAPQVNNILNCDEGLRIRAEAIKRLRGILMGSVDDRMNAIVDKTISRTHDLITNDEIFAKAPITAIKTALALGKATGHFKDDSHDAGASNFNSGNTFINNSSVTVIGEGGVNILKEALKNSDEAKRINGGMFDRGQNQIAVVSEPVKIDVK